MFYAAFLEIAESTGTKLKDLSLILQNEIGSTHNLKFHMLNDAMIKDIQDILNKQVVKQYF